MDKLIYKCTSTQVTLSKCQTSINSLQHHYPCDLEKVQQRAAEATTHKERAYVGTKPTYTQLRRTIALSEQHFKSSAEIGVNVESLGQE